MTAHAPARGPVRYADEVPVDGWLTAATEEDPAALRVDRPLRLVDLSPVGKVSVHADPAGPFAVELGVEAGAVELFDDGLLVAGVTPGEWLALTPGSPAVLVRQLQQLADDDDIVTVDLTHGLGVFRLIGPAVPAVLARLAAVPLDDRRVPDASARTTLLGGARSLLVRDDLLVRDEVSDRDGAGVDAVDGDDPVGEGGLVPSVIVVCDRSQAASVYGAIRVAGDDLGLLDEGYATYRSHHTDA